MLLVFVIYSFEKKTVYWACKGLTLRYANLLTIKQMIALKKCQNLCQTKIKLYTYHKIGLRFILKQLRSDIWKTIESAR